MRSLRKWMAGACAALLVAGSSANAQHVAHGGKLPSYPVAVPAPQYCPPGQHPGVMPAPGMLPGQVMPQPIPGQPNPAQPNPAQPNPAQPNPAQPNPAQPNPADINSQSDFAAAGATGDEGGGGTGGTQIGGRIDALNRFNLFDNMSAIPQSRIWFNYMYGADFKTGYQTARSVQEFELDRGLNSLANNRALNLYRFGVEYAFTKNFSIAAQGVYAASVTAGLAGESGVNADTFGNPHLMAKYALVNCPDRVISATFGIIPQIGSTPFELRENTTRLQPGFLVYQTLSDANFVQGGAQLNFATDDLADTFDYAISFGRWFYRDANLDTSGRLRCGACGQPAFFRGMLGQVELFGKQVFDGNVNSPLNTGNAPIVYKEQPTNLDITVNGRLLLGRANINLGVGYPIISEQVRNFELLAGINLNY